MAPVRDLLRTPRIARYVAHDRDAEEAKARRRQRWAAVRRATTYAAAAVGALATAYGLFTVATRRPKANPDAALARGDVAAYTAALLEDPFLASFSESARTKVAAAATISDAKRAYADGFQAAEEEITKVLNKPRESAVVERVDADRVRVRLKEEATEELVRRYGEHVAPVLSLGAMPKGGSSVLEVARDRLCSDDTMIFLTVVMVPPPGIEISARQKSVLVLWPGAPALETVCASARASW